MGHAAVQNRTSFAFMPLYLADEDGHPLLVALVQATYEIVPGQGLFVTAEQPPPSLEGELWGKDASVSSYRMEPVFAYTKPSTDVVLVGHAYAPQRQRVTELQVLFRVGPVGKTLRVIGDRTWVKSGTTITPTSPLPFDRMPLVYERAFGGWDRSHADPSAHRFEPRNPVGMGFRLPTSAYEEGLRLPNIEDPAEPLEHYGQVVKPAGVGFTSPHWQPRASYAGTYDEAWQRERMPLLPRDFDKRYFNGASQGLVASGYLHGDEQVLVENASPSGRISFRLPRRPPPRCRVGLRGGDAEPPMVLDTVVVNADRERVTLMYRAHVVLREGPHDVLGIEVDEL